MTIDSTVKHALAFLGFWLLILMALNGCQSTQTALKAIDDQKWEKAESTLEQLLAKKNDSLFADVYYGLSLLYSDSLYQHYQIDTAYHFILQAERDLPQTSVKEQEKLARSIPLTEATILLQKRYLDSLAFQRSLALSTVTDYQFFLDQHQDAPQRDTVVQLRNQLAFAAAQQLDSYQAYRDFMDTYPEAEQYSQAEERYNTLVFNAQTQTGDLASYYQFVDAFPNSPYRPQAEEAIFQIVTADNQPQKYSQFIQDFPKSPLSRQAVNWLYHLYQEDHPTDSFYSKYPTLPFLDSLREAQTVSDIFVVPVLQQGKYGFINSEGAVTISPQYDDVLPEYVCYGVQSGSVFASENSQLKMLTKDGQLVNSLGLVDDQLPEVNELGGGLFWLKWNNTGTLIHASGTVIISEEESASDIELITGTSIPFQFIKYRVSEQWGLKSFIGTTLLEPAYDDIQEQGEFIVLEQNGKLAITNRQQLIDQAENPGLSLSFQYEDASLLDQDYLLAYTRDYETVLDTALQAVVPLGKQTVLQRLPSTDRFLIRTSEEQQRVVNDSLITERKLTYSLYPSLGLNSSPTETEAFSQAYYNDQWLALKGNQKYILLDNQTPDFTSTTYDSIKILSEHFAILFHGPSQKIDSTTLLISQHEPIVLRFAPDGVQSSELNFRLLRTQGRENLESAQESLLITQPGKPELLLTQSSDTVLETSLDDVTTYPEGIYVIEKKGKEGIVDKSGNELVPVKYQRIGSYQSNGILSLFDRKMFGLYHQQTSTFIEPAYEAALRLYAIVLRDSVPMPLFIAQKNGKIGIVNSREQVHLPFSFESVRYWNDSSALVRFEDQWHIYPLSPEPQRRLNFEENEFLYSGIEEFTTLESAWPEVLIKIYKNGGYGVLSNQRAELLSPTFDDIRYFQGKKDDQNLFLTEKYVSEAKLHILIYLDAQGEMIYREAYSPDDYDKLYCEE
jgi:hypothetical protein